jgi:cytosine/adenosine deaminase-related metal-dependent hydrolase/ubiquinone/menaquinone biosynthesis C-methylase UbiE
MTTLPSLFDQWAEVYDAEPNPLLALEERTLLSLLPDIADAHVLDVGCGTGRWLQQLEALQPASLTGADPSAAMLAIARRKLSPNTILVDSPATRLPVPASSRDLVLASFVLSYIEDLAAFAVECARLLKPEAPLLITDMHPVTAAARNWTRSFKQGGQRLQISAQTRSLHAIIAAFEREGLVLVERHEPAFAEAERPLFVQAGKQSVFEELQHEPAIYLLKFSKQTSLQLLNARSSTGPSTWSTAPLHLAKGRIGTVSDPEAHLLDLSGYSILPGLINAHDHLEFALFPNLGRAQAQSPYRNSPEWAREIHETHADTIAKHCKVPLAARLWFGILRNLLAGVTTVCHHNVIHPELTLPGLPIHIVTEMGWAHSLTFDPDLASSFTRTPASQPFILHAAEGTDEASRNELYRLDVQSLLTARTVIVHGLALQGQDIALLNQRGSALIFCPTSNRFLFAESPSNDAIESTQRAALASDSPLTAAGDLLDEIACLRDQGLDATTLYNLVTTNPAEILNLREGQGTLTPNAPADLIVARSAHTTPAEALAHLTLAQIELVIAKGQIQLASAALYLELPASLRDRLHRIEIDALEYWVNVPLPAIFASAEQVLGRDNLRLGNKEVRHRNPL